MCGVDLSHSQPGAAGWFVQSFVLSCGLVVDRLVHMVILWWTPCSSCRAVHSASLKLSRSSGGTYFGWLLVVHGKHEGVLGQQAIKGGEKQATNPQHPASSSNTSSCRLVHLSRGQGHRQPVLVAHLLSMAYLNLAVDGRVIQVAYLVCVCVPVKPTRGNTT